MLRAKKKRRALTAQRVHGEAQRVGPPPVVSPALAKAAPLAKPAPAPVEAARDEDEEEDVESLEPSPEPMIVPRQRTGPRPLVAVSAEATEETVLAPAADNRANGAPTLTVAATKERPRRPRKEGPAREEAAAPAAAQGAALPARAGHGAPHARGDRRSRSAPRLHLPARKPASGAGPFDVQNATEDRARLCRAG